MTHRKYIIVFFIGCLIALSACKDKWNDHYDINNNQFAGDVLQKIKTTPDLSTFYDYLVKTGYDKVLVSSEAFTVWAPTNEALAGIDQAIVSDTAKLKQLIGNHICYQSYYFDDKAIDSALRVKTLNGKYIDILRRGQTIGGASLVEPYDNPCRNGVLHVISGVITYKPTIRDLLKASDPNLEQPFFISTFDKIVFDEPNSKKIGVNSQGFTVYDSVWVGTNQYLTNIARLDDESQQFTYILLTNKAFDQGFKMYKPFAQMPLALSSDSLAAYYVCADLAFKGRYTLQNLPDTLISTLGTKVHIPASYITSVTEASNGIVLTLDTFPVKLTAEVKPIIIEGENSDGRKFSGSTSFTYIAQRYNALASGGYDLAYNPGGSKAINVQFTANKAFSTKYKFYWVASNYTFGTSGFSYSSFMQSLSVSKYNASTSLISFAQTTTTAGYTETYLGEFTFTEFNNRVSLKITGSTISVPTTPTATTLATPVSVDYIKMVPVTQ